MTLIEKQMEYIVTKLILYYDLILDLNNYEFCLKPLNNQQKLKIKHVNQN